MPGLQGAAQMQPVRWHKGVLLLVHELLQGQNQCC
jgi:hypothetical protein